MGTAEQLKYYVTQVREEILDEFGSISSRDITAGVNYPESQTKLLTFPLSEGRGARLVSVQPGTESSSSFDIFVSDQSTLSHPKRRKIGNDYFVYQESVFEEKPCIVGRTLSGEAISIHVVSFEYPAYSPHIKMIAPEVPELESAAD